MTTKYHLIRFFDSPPFDRWAMTIERDKATPDGFRITSSDPEVASSEFIAQVAQTMREPQVAIRNGDHHAYYPGSELHFEYAVRHVPGAAIGSSK